MPHLLLAVLIALSVGALAQTCEPFTADVPQCAGLVNYPVWVPPGLTQQLLASALGQYASGVSLLPGDCARVAIATLCSSAFRGCNVSDPSLPYPLCGDFCSRGLAACAGIPQAQAILNCSASDPFLGASVPLWSSVQTCSIANASTPVLSCPLPFKYHPALQACSMKCPPIGLDDPSVNDKVWIISKVFGSTSLVLEVLILFPVWHQTTKGQLNCMLHFWIANLLGSIGNLTPRWWSWESAMCYDEFTLRTASSTTCFVTAFGALVALTAVAYWLMFAMYTLLIRQPSYSWLSLSFHLGDRYTLLTERNILLAIGWGVPSIQFLIALCSGWLNSSAGPLACSVDPTIYNGWALNGLIFVPLTIVLSISTIIICIVMFIVVKHGFGAIKSQWRILAVGAYYVVAVWVVLGYAWHSYAERDDITKAVVAAIGASVASGGTVLREKNPISGDFNVAVVAITTSIGTVLGLLFLLTPGHWRYYMHVIDTGRLSWGENETGGGSANPTSSRRTVSQSASNM